MHFDLWETWKSLKLYPWDWLTDGVRYMEHINSLKAQERLFNDAQEKKAQASREMKSGERHEHEW